MDPKTEKVTVSRDVAEGKVDLESFSEDAASSERGSNISSSSENIHQAETSDAVLQRSLRQRKQPDYLGDYEVQMNHSSVLSCFFIGDTCDGEPKSYNKAKGIAEWEEAMKEEISALNKNCTWELIPMPKGADLVACKWVYKLKKKADGTVERHKARLVARGFS